MVSGWTAMAVKAHGQDPSAVVARANELHVVVLLVPDDLDWHTLALAITAAVTPSVSPVPGSSSFGDLFALANAIAVSVGGATTIEDFQQRILAHSTIAGQVIDAGRRDGILGRRVPDAEANVEQYRTLYRSGAVQRFPAVPPAFPRVAVSIRGGTEVLGSLWVVDAGSLAQDIDQALSAAADLAASHLLRDRLVDDAERAGRFDALTRLLGGDPDPTVTADLMGLDPHGPYAVLALGSTAPVSGVAELYRVVNLATLHAEAQLGRSCGGLIGGAAHLIVSGRRVADPVALRSCALHLEAVMQSALRLPVAVAIGATSPSLSGVPAAADEARRVLALIRRNEALPRVATAQVVADELSLAALQQLTEGDERALSGVALAVLSYDKSEGTQYADLLYTWLENHRDIRRTAAQLSAHPNTIRYRLRRATRLFGLDYDDSDQGLVLWLTLKLARISGAG